MNDDRKRRSHSRTLGWLPVAAAVWCASSVPAIAQPGLLTQVYAPGQVNVDPQGGNGLVLRLDAFDHYYRNNYAPVVTPPGVTPPPVPALPPTTQPVYLSSGNRFGATGDLSYRYDRTGTRGNFAVDALGSATAYTETRRVLYRGIGTIAGSTTLGRRNAVHGNYSLTYAPYYNFGLFAGLNVGVAGALADPELNYAVSPLRTFRHSVGAGFNRGLSRKATFSADYSAQYHDHTQGRLVEQNIGARVSYQATRDLGMRFGYYYRRGSYAGAGIPVRDFHDLDIGIDYQRGVSLVNRRLTFRATTGSSVSVREGSRSLVSGGNLGNRLDIRLIAQATLNYDIGRAWGARLAYHRGWQFVDVFANPMFYDTVTASIGGPLGERLSSGASLQYLHGDDGYGSAPHDAYVGRAGVTMRIAGALSAFGNYTYYHEELPTSIVVPVGFPPALKRSGVRGGVSYAMTLLGNPRGRP